ncbi:site-specific integrase [Dysgonomonas sp. ZJ709]|uniref:site-specific integrase n=1 Tax=Dysgonomonas sp. ZJ709 TaxID=2709797 RepID=UPI0013ED36C9|nr:site-specific integrase [Dysgonomonas sp. ZJ709]
MKATFRTLFYLRKNRPNSNGLVSIMARITVNGQITQFNTKLEVNPDIWDTKLGKVKGRNADATNLNRLLDNLRTKMDKIYNKLMDTKGYALPETIKNILFGIDPERKTLLQYFTLHNEQYKLKVGKTTSQITYSRYELTKERVEEFIKKEYKLSDILLPEIDFLFVEKFYLSLRNDHDCSNNTAMKFIQRFRSVFTFSINLGAEVKINPFANFKFHNEKVHRQVLTQEEIDTIYRKEFLTERLSQIRDVFIFMCYTGLSYIDVARLTEDSVKTAFDGHQWIMIQRQKTSVPSNIRLLDIPLEIIERYKGQQTKGQLFPVCSNQKMNEYLKEIAIICGINKPMTCHIARHTFGTTVTLANGVPIETVSKMLGHTDIKTTQIYAKIVDQKLSSDMDSLAETYRSRKYANK